MLIHSEKQCEKKRIAQEKVNQHKKQPHWIAMRLLKILLINTAESCNIKTDGIMYQTYQLQLRRKAHGKPGVSIPEPQTAFARAA